MKILIVGDPHFKFELPYASSIPDGRKKEWENVKKTIHDAAKTCSTVVLLGDGFNARHNHSSVIREFVDFLNGFGDKEIYILAGNHERYGKSTALDFLKNIDKKNIHIYDQPSVVKIGTKTAMMIPFMTPALMETDSIEGGTKALNASLVKADLAFAHQAVSGAKSSEYFNEIILDKDKVSKTFGMTFAGHLHHPENLAKNIQITGSLFTQEVGERVKQVYIWDTVKKSNKVVQLPVRGIHKMVWEKRDLGEMLSKNSIVKCYVTDKATDLEDVKKKLKFFDAAIIIEQYQDERSKVHFDEGSLDLSVEALLKLYAENKQLSYEELKAGLELIT